MTDYNLRIKLLRTLSTFIPLLEERELVIVDDNGIGQASIDSSLKVYDPDKTDIKQLYKTMKKPAKFIIEQPQTIQEGTTYFDKTDYALKRYNGTDWEIIGRTIDLDNNLDGAWTRCINIPILTPPSENIQYKIEINGDNILVYSNDGTAVLASGNGGLDFWSNVQSDGKDIRICNENYEQNYFWIEEFDYTNKRCIIWVKLYSGQEVINVAYGNDNCLTSNYHNGDLTFIYFDDFLGTTIDTNKWTIVASGFTVSNSELSVHQSGYASIQSVTTYTGNLIYGSKFRRNTDNNYDTSIGFVVDGNTTIRFGTGIHNYGDEFFHEFVSFKYKSMGLADDMYHRYEYLLNWDGTQTNGTYVKDGVTDITSSTTNYTTNTFRLWINSGSCVVDYIYLRKYLPSDISFGTPIVKVL